jgi:hypothetical protein
MYLFLNALIVALLLPAGATSVADAGPTCRAQLHGLNLLTVVELPTGVAVEGPWRVTHQKVGEGAPFRLLATLDHVVETDALTGDRSVIPFPQPVRLSFEGATQEEVVRRAARVWCVTVLRAQENRTLDHLGDAQPSRIAALRSQVLEAA